MSLTRQPSDSPTTEPPRRGRRTIALVAIASVLLLAGGAVGIWLLRGTDEQPAAPVTPTATPEVSAAPSITSPASPEDEAAAAAIARYEEYFAVTNAVGQSGYLDLAPYTMVAVDPELTELRVAAATYVSQGLRLVGATSFASLRVDSVSLRSDDGYYPEVKISACVDRSNLTVIDASGQNINSPDRHPQTAVTATVRRYEPGTPGVPPAGGWFVAETTGAGDPC